MRVMTKGALQVSGLIQLVRRGKGLLLINHVDLEEYVKGVVPAEVNAAWHPEMLKVQAIAARTYALYQHMLSATRDYDVVAGIQDQVYRGRQGIDARVIEAVESTRGLVVTHQGAPIYAAFSSTAAGITEDAMIVWSKDLPYLKGVECPFDHRVSVLSVEGVHQGRHLGEEFAATRICGGNNLGHHTACL